MRTASRARSMNGMERDIIHGKYQTIVLGAMTSEGEVVPAGSSGQLYRCVSRVRDLRIVIVSHSDITYRECEYCIIQINVYPDHVLTE